MILDLTALAADIARHVGEEFPAPLSEMVARQYPALVEEADELDSALAMGDLLKIREEAADTVITCYLLAHYINALPNAVNGPLDLDLAKVEAFPPFSPAATSIVKRAARVAGPFRRFMGYARRSGTLAELALVLGSVLLTVQAIATRCGFDLDAAIAEKAQVIFARGWREEVPQ